MSYKKIVKKIGSSKEVTILFVLNNDVMIYIPVTNYILFNIVCQPNKQIGLDICFRIV